MLEYYISPLADKFKISQPFGVNPERYKPMGFNGHMGVDYACPEPTPVQAVFWGEVIEIGFTNTGYGAYIKIKHGDYICIYAHLSLIKVVRGCYVTQGQIIGYSGNTGNSTGPHLHFEMADPKLENNGFHGRIDPLPLITNLIGNTDAKLNKIRAEIRQIQVDKYTKDSMYIHVKYIEKILLN